MRKKRKVILLIILGLFLFLKNDYLNKISYNVNVLYSQVTNTSEYKIIKKDANKKYSGIGQESISNKDGYFTTFTTIDKKTYIEYKQNGNASWSNHQYWDGTMAENGCGITALSIILSGYNQTYTPEDLRKKYYPVLNYDSLSQELSNNFNIKNSGFYYDSAHLSKDMLQKHLETNRPILICVWNQPYDNRWTSASHYMVLLAGDGDNMVYISNPNGGKNDSKSSGWYDFKEVTPYIAKALYIESYH